MKQNAFLFRDSRYGGVVSMPGRHIKLPDPLKNFLPSMTFRNNIATPAMDSARGTLTLDNYRKTPDTVEPGVVSFRFELPIISDINDAKTAGRPVRTSSVLLSAGQLSTLTFDHLMAVVEQLRNMPLSPARELFGSTLFRILQDLSATPSGASRGREIGAALTQLRTSVPALTSFSIIPPTGIIPVPPVPTLPPPFVPPIAPAFTPPGVAPIPGAAPVVTPVVTPVASPDFQPTMDAIDLLVAGVDQKDPALTDIIDFMTNTTIDTERDAVLNKLRTKLSSIGYDVDADNRLDLTSSVAPLVVSTAPEVLVESAVEKLFADKTYTDAELDAIQLLIDDVKDKAKNDEYTEGLRIIRASVPTLLQIDNLTTTDDKDPDIIAIREYIDKLTNPDVQAGLTAKLANKIAELSGGPAPLVVSSKPGGPAPSTPSGPPVPTVAEERYTLPDLVALQSSDNKKWLAFLASIDPAGMYYSEPRSRVGQKPGDAKRGDYINRWIDPTNRDVDGVRYIKSIRNRVTDYKKAPTKFVDPDGIFSNVLGYIHAPSFP